MTTKNRNGLIISAAVHLIAVIALSLLHHAVANTEELYQIESVIADDQREFEEIQQELDTQTEIAETLNFVAGSVSSTNVGSAGGGALGADAGASALEKIEASDAMSEPELDVAVGFAELPAGDVLSNDLGAGEVSGEVGALVEGYGAALDRLTQELIRLMRKEPLLVVWLFDESESMKDDQAELKQRIYRVYEELRLVSDSDTGDKGPKRKRKLSDLPLVTAITSFGQDFHIHTKEPTNDEKVLMAAIDGIPIDRTGVENTNAAVISVVNQYRKLAQGSDRKLVIVLVSDESGDDGEALLEDAVHAVKQMKAPVYIMGRESVFGTLYAYIRWIHPDYGSLHYLPIRRGPETPFAELLQFDGFRNRRDAQMSGFGPYDQVRLARDSGGIFFQLPHEEQNLNDFAEQKENVLVMREYLPSLDARRKYVEERDRSPFRQAVWKVIVMLNPYDPAHAEITVPTEGVFSRDPASYQPAIGQRIQRCLFTLGVLNIAQQELEGVKSLRAKERSVRWRANFDLMYAQLYAYRLRLFEYALGLDQNAKALATYEFANEKADAWYVGIGAPGLIYPDEVQAKALKITKADIETTHKKAEELLNFVIKSHPNTSWAQRAQWEFTRNFGVNFAEYETPPPVPRPVVANPVPIPNL
ncbi:MAG: VWA domain-containing protein [Planctomycetota bacterium]|nr:VWA domain-containing protein [Planctomycetota bacterium]MDA1212461.1 VWA domain-containing protein [Planctomycetota bacterium]